MSLAGMVDSAVDRFTTLDTAQQRQVLKRVGEETETADRMLAALRNYPDRFHALSLLMGYEQEAA